MAQPQRTSSTDSTADALRKRVCKACDRCRLKKSKCDGSHPCTRCKADNAICVFGERKKSHDKVYPKGYVEMLEQQQGQLVSGLQEMYHRMYRGERWTAPKLSETNGQPLTHDILAALGLLETKQDGSGEVEPFEEDVEKIQSRLLAEGAGYVRRRGSFSSESEHSQHSHSKSSSRNTPPMTKQQQPIFDKNFTFSASPSPLMQSPAPRPRKSYPPAHESPLHRATTVVNNDPQLFQPPWATTFTADDAGKVMRSNMAMKTPHLDQTLDQTNDYFQSSQWDDTVAPFDTNLGFGAFTQQFPSCMSQYGAMSDYTNSGFMDLDPMDDFKAFIQV